MYKEVLSAVTGNDLYPVVSLLLFVVSFGIAFVRAVRMDRARAEQHARLPLEE